MKTNKTIKTTGKNSSELKNRTEQLAVKTENTPEKSQTVTQNAPVKPYVNFSERDFNRKLPVEKVLEKLARWMPEQYKLAKVVGRWVWVTFTETPPERVRAELSQLGFHWNNTRKCWQHPCGETLPRGQDEPEQKYKVWFPGADARREKEALAQAAA